MAGCHTGLTKELALPRWFIYAVFLPNSFPSGLCFQHLQSPKGILWIQDANEIWHKSHLCSLVMPHPITTLHSAVTQREQSANTWTAKSTRSIKLCFNCMDQIHKNVFAVNYGPCKHNYCSLKVCQFPMLYIAPCVKMSRFIAEETPAHSNSDFSVLH